jgi:hypothetical protein
MQRLEAQTGSPEWRKRSVLGYLAERHRNRIGSAGRSTGSIAPRMAGAAQYLQQPAWTRFAQMGRPIRPSPASPISGVTASCQTGCLATAAVPCYLLGGADPEVLEKVHLPAGPGDELV